VSRTLSGVTTVLLLAPLCALMALFFIVPLGQIAWTSVYDGKISFNAYVTLFSSALMRLVLIATFQIAITSTLVSLLISYPIALHLASQTPRKRGAYMLLVLLPFWTSILVKSFALVVILGDKGLINSALAWASNGSLRIPMVFNRTGVIIGMVNYLVPFMVLPILASLLAQDRALHRAAEVMGAGPIRIFWRITVPLSLPGVISGVLLNLAIAIGFYITPSLLGGRRDVMMANLVDLYTRQTLNWQLASAVAMILFVISVFLFLLLMRSTEKPVV